MTPRTCRRLPEVGLTVSDSDADSVRSTKRHPPPLCPRMLIMMLGRFQRSLGRTVVTSFIAFIVVPSHADSSPPIFEPCPEVACGGSDAASVLGNAPPRRAWRVNTNISGKSDGDTPHVSAPPITPPAHGIPLECPPDRAALGTHAWSFVRVYMRWLVRVPYLPVIFTLPLPLPIPPTHPPTHPAPCRRSLFSRQTNGRREKNRHRPNRHTYNAVPLPPLPRSL